MLAWSHDMAFVIVIIIMTPVCDLTLLSFTCWMCFSAGRMEYIPADDPPVPHFLFVLLVFNLQLSWIQLSWFGLAIARRSTNLR